jgi:ketosteroid isomerase-like protein
MSAMTSEWVVREFFERYRRHDVDGMTDLCSLRAEFSYVPFEIWGKQRVLRGDGKVHTVGKTIWHGLIASFPDLTNTVQTVIANNNGDVVAEVDIAGTQQLPWAFVTPARRRYDEPHLFIFRVDVDDMIEHITAYWDNAGINRQLGHNEVD